MLSIFHARQTHPDHLQSCGLCKIPFHYTFAILILLVSGCGTLPREPVPLDKMARAEVVGMPDVRAWGGQVDPKMQADLVTSIKQEQPGEYSRHGSGVPIYDALALSGGGSNGAFGAGFLNGWTQAGTRPKFKIVTGISTGALIAPFAFLGSHYDEQLKSLYTTISTADILEERGYLAALGSESFTTTEPLARLIAENITADVMSAVARAHNRGRRLYIGTVNMDAQRLVVWNMGLIANSGHADALKLFQQVLLASASIPAAFPPVYIEVEADGKRYDEMHADGGTVTQVFFYGGILDIEAAARQAGMKSAVIQKANIYIIRNGQLNPEAEHIPRKLFAITGRALDTMIKMAANNDLYRVFAFAKREKIDFNYVDIPDDFEFNAKEAFDREEMQRLYKVGYDAALAANPWQTLPPGFQGVKE